MKHGALILVAATTVGLGCPKTKTAPSDASLLDAGARTSTNDRKSAKDTTLAALDDPETCGACHAQVLAEWKTSLHAHAHHEKDELYRAIRVMRMEKEGAGIAKTCALCHSPRGTDDPEGLLARVGVGCASCHLTKEVQAGPGRLGANALIFDADGVMRGPHGPSPKEAPHGFAEPAGHLTDGRTICLACHDELRNPAGIPICTTGMEWKANEGAPSCVSCHMPALDGPSGVVSPERTTHRSHAFLGPHRAFRDGDIAFMKTALGLSATLEGDRLAVRIENKSAHALPSGFPARLLVVQVLGHDKDDQLLYSSFKENPSQETPEAVFGKVYVDDKGVPTLAPWSTKLERDSRLAAGEVRELSMTLPPSVKRATIKVFFRLLSPPLARRLELDSKPIGGGKVIALTVVHRAEKATKPKRKAGRKK